MYGYGKFELQKPFYLSEIAFESIISYTKYAHKQYYLDCVSLRPKVFIAMTRYRSQHYSTYNNKGIYALQ